MEPHNVPLSRTSSSTSDTRSLQSSRSSYSLKDKVGRFVVLLVRPERINYLYRDLDTTYIHERTTDSWIHERIRRKTSQRFSWMITCIDPENQWHEERFLASLARSKDAGAIIAQGSFPGPFTTLEDVRLQHLDSMSPVNEAFKQIPKDVCRTVLVYWPWLHETTFFKQMLPGEQPASSQGHIADVAYMPSLATRPERPTPRSTLTSPASFMTAPSPASFVTARSTPRSALTSPAFMSARSTPQSTQTSPAYLMAGVLTAATPSRFETIQEETDGPTLPPQLLKLKREYLNSLQEKSLLQSLDAEVNWSGRGQHVTFQPTEDVPLRHLGHLGASMSATVDKVLCRRVALARKTIKCTPRFKVADALIEVSHLQRLQHFHIVQLVGSYLQGRNFSILMYPVADSHLGTFLEDTAEITDQGAKVFRYEYLCSIFGCLASAFNFIHKHSTKHMDVKPQNILVRRSLSREDWEGLRVYIADFGFSRDYTAQGHSQTDGRASLTPRYCAPEVFGFEARGRSADIFSLGCVFLEILTVLAGQHPYEFTEFRIGESDDDSFHANLYQVALWAEAYFRRGIDLKYCDLKIGCSISEMVEMMVGQAPSERPTASDLERFFAGLPANDCCKTKADCCARPPEAYIPAHLDPRNDQTG
jgi:hypothetical protein